MTRGTDSSLGPLLRHWRDLRGKSQLGLSLETGISQRHISFVESGRSIPSRRLLIDIAEALDVPLRERNALLLAAGYAPVYAESAWDAPEMQSVHRAVQRMLKQHEPFPAVVLDRAWNVLQTNAAAPRFFGSFIDIEARTGPRNMLHLMFDPNGLRPFLVDWATVAKSLLARVRREAVGGVADKATLDLVEALLAYPDVEPAWSRPDLVPPMPFIPLSFAKGGMVLNYFSLVTTVGTPQMVAAQELRLETMFPADAVTEAEHVRLMAAVA